jgi:hypothetical protein
VSAAHPPAESAPAPRATGAERIVAVALGAMIAVLLWVWIDLRKSARAEAMALDFTNPLLSAEAGECIEVEDRVQPGVASRLVVIAPAEGAARGRGAAVLRPREGPPAIPGWIDRTGADLRTTAPYLACEARTGPDAPPGSPAARREVLLFDLNAFGMSRGSTPSTILREIRPELVSWEGKPQRCHRVTVTRFDQFEGNWQLFLARDARALGTVLRKYHSDPSRATIQQSFHPCK